MVDATCDPDYRFEDLENAVRKIRIDFGIAIVFPEGLPTPAWSRGDAHKNQHSAVGTIRYSDIDGPGTDGVIIYLKPLLSGDEPLDVTRYATLANKKQQHPFPHHSTADQFFDEVQFESYRALGYHSVMRDHYLSRETLAARWPAPVAGAVDANEDKLAAAEQRDGQPPAAAADGGGLLERLGPTAVLWGALALGGTAGVNTVMQRWLGGEVTLKQPAEVSVKPITPPITPPPPPPDVPLPDARWQELTLRLSELLTATERLQVAVATNTTVSTQEITAMHELLRLELQLIKEQRQPGASRPDIDILVAALQRVQLRIKDDPHYKGQLDAIVTTLAAIQVLLEKSRVDERLQGIENAVRQTGPRVNVRTGEGARQ